MGLEEYLRIMDAWRGANIPEGYTFASYEDLVLDRGTTEVSRALTPEQRLLVRDYLRTANPKLKECYYNAQRLALYAPDRFTYREGWAQGSTLAVQHAWCVLDGECVIDLTWRHGKFRERAYATTARRVRGVLPEGWEYRGISYSKEAIEERIYSFREWASFHDDWRHGHPLLKTPRKSPRSIELATRVTEMRMARE